MQYRTDRNTPPGLLLRDGLGIALPLVASVFLLVTSAVGTVQVAVAGISGLGIGCGVSYLAHRSIDGDVSTPHYLAVFVAIGAFGGGILYYGLYDAAEGVVVVLAWFWVLAPLSAYDFLTSGPVDQ